MIYTQSLNACFDVFSPHMSAFAPQFLEEQQTSKHHLNLFCWDQDSFQPLQKTLDQVRNVSLCLWEEFLLILAKCEDL